MEDVLDVYKQPYDPLYPQVCFDECSKQLVIETRLPFLWSRANLPAMTTIRAQWSVQLIPIFRAAQGMATCGSHGQTDRHRLCPTDEISG